MKNKRISNWRGTTLVACILIIIALWAHVMISTVSFLMLGFAWNPFNFDRLHIFVAITIYIAANLVALKIATYLKDVP